jgi:regulatory protein
MSEPDERDLGPEPIATPRSSAPQEPPDHEEVARKILLDQLTGQPRSRHELAERLARRNVPDEVAGPLLDRFEEVGLVDDEAFARLWVDSRQRTRGLARRALAQELRRKGVADETAREVLADVDPGDEEQVARELVRRKLRSLRTVDDATAARRLAGMLARKGYPAGQAYAVVKDELAAAGRDHPGVPQSEDVF